MNLTSTIQLQAKHDSVHSPQRWRTVCVDFDGVLNNSSGPYHQNHFGAPLVEGLRLLRLLLEDGYNVVILTARKETDSVALWLKDHGFPGMFVTNTKVPAQAYVDDRGVHWHEGQTAEVAMSEIEKRPGRVIHGSVAKRIFAHHRNSWNPRAFVVVVRAQGKSKANRAA